jgi:hypothetical protein
MASDKAARECRPALWAGGPPELAATIHIARCAIVDKAGAFERSSRRAHGHRDYLKDLQRASARLTFCAASSGIGAKCVDPSTVAAKALTGERSAMRCFWFRQIAAPVM